MVGLVGVIHSLGLNMFQVRFDFIRAITGTLLFIAGSFVSLEAAAASRIADALFAQFLYRPHLQRMTVTRATSSILSISQRRLRHRRDRARAIP